MSNECNTSMFDISHTYNLSYYLIRFTAIKMNIKTHQSIQTSLKLIYDKSLTSNLPQNYQLPWANY